MDVNLNASPSYGDAVAPADGADHAGAHAPTDARPPRGLPNSDGETCYVNAPLQLVLNSAVLRQYAEMNQPDADLDALFRAFDNPAETLDSEDDLKVRRDVFVANLRERANAPAATTKINGLIPAAGLGHSGEAMSVLLDTLDSTISPLESLMIVPDDDEDGSVAPLDDRYAAAVASAYAADKRVFIMPEICGFDAVTKMAQAADTTVSGFTYFIGGHYVAYICKGKQWYKADDSITQAVSIEDLTALRVAVPRLENTDVTFAQGFGIEVFSLN